MSDRRKRAVQVIGHQKSNAALMTRDSFQNFVSKVGFGTGNQGDGAQYGFNPVTRDRLQLEWMFRGSWVCGVATSCVAEDMTREGVDIDSEMDPTDIKKLEREVTRLQIWPKLGESLTWARLYGGGLAYLMIDGQNPATPLKLETLRKGQFKGIQPLDRWMVYPSLGELIGELGPNLGMPMYYTTVPDTRGMPILKIHHSRVIRFEGIQLPYFQRQTENLWGISVLERMFDRLIAFDSTTQGAAQLAYKAHLRTLKIEGLRDVISMGGPALDGIAKNVEMIRALQTNEGLTLLDSKDEFDVHQYTFTGFDKLLEAMGAQVAGALEVPQARLFGQAPGGLNADGESQFRNYYDKVKQRQVRDLGPGIEKIYAICHINKFGTMPPEEFALDFRSLWQLSDDQAADVVNKSTASIVAAFEAHIINRATALKELKQLSRSTGAYSNISEEDINEAENDPAPSAEALGLELPAKPDNAGRPGQGAKSKAANGKG